MERGPAVAADMVRVEGGTLGRHEIERFDLDRHEVTVRSYERCVAAEKCLYPSCTEGNRVCAPGHECFDPLVECSALLNWGHDDRLDHPIVGVSYTDAASYCEWAGRRLPSAREWQWAAQGREQARRFPWGDEPPTPAAACWHRDEGGTCPVESTAQDVSRDGVFDLAGNVSEWTMFAAESWGLMGDRPDQHLVRGGSWGELHVEPLETGYSIAVVDDVTADDIGFRCAADVAVASP